MEQLFLIALIFVGIFNGYTSKTLVSEIFWMGFFGCAIVGLIGISLIPLLGSK